MAFFDEIRTNTISANVDTLKTVTQAKAKAEQTNRLIHDTSIKVLSLARATQRLSAMGTNESIKVTADILETCYKKVQSAEKYAFHAPSSPNHSHVSAAAQEEGSNLKIGGFK